jgi:hypothetical protein
MDDMTAETRQDKTRRNEAKRNGATTFWLECWKGTVDLNSTTLGYVVHSAVRPFDLRKSAHSSIDNQLMS